MTELYKQNVIMNTYYVDRNRIAKPSGIMREMQEAGSQQMAHQKPSYDELLDEGKALMVSRLDLIIPEEIHLSDEVTVASWPCPSTRATFLRCYSMERDGKRVAFVSSQWSLVDMKSRKILKVDDVDFTNYYHGEYTEAIPGKFKIDKDAPLKKVGEKKVMFSDLDYNGHMNNTYYFDMICDYVPELAEGTHRVNEVRIHFSREASLNDKLVIKRYETPEGKYIFQTFKEDGDVNIEAEIGLTKIKNRALL